MNMKLRPDTSAQQQEGSVVPQIVVLPHASLCPDGTVIEAPAGKSVCDVLLENDIEIEHACEKSCACTTCHVVVREGYDSLNEPQEKEEDLLDMAWGLEATSRLSCQAIVGEEDLVVEIPKYTINHARENH
jgi:2Fe-2S ferredoxin